MKQSTSNPSQHSADELLKYFWPHPYPQHLPPITVIFHNGLPLDNDDTAHMVFQMPYNTFRTAIEAEKRAYALEARADELEHITGFSDVGGVYTNAGLDTSMEWRPIPIKERISELRRKAKGGSDE